jgi:hypothetical protein
LDSHDPYIKHPAVDLKKNMRTTANCRFNAAVRLQRQGKVAFITTTLVSLGLIFIPLMQLAKISLNIEDNILNVIQIFLAVAVLIYSSIISTAGYELRAQKLHECGVKLKALEQKLDMDSFPGTATTPPLNLTSLQTEYTDILAHSENHDLSDYLLAKAELPHYYSITGWKKLICYSKAYFMIGQFYFFPVILLLSEISIILYMVPYTHPYVLRCF